MLNVYDECRNAECHRKIILIVWVPEHQKDSFAK
jgi:hypothetical protein